MEPSNPEALKEYGGLYYNAKQYAKALEKWKALLAQKNQRTTAGCVPMRLPAWGICCKKEITAAKG